MMSKPECLEKNPKVVGGSLGALTALFLQLPNLYGPQSSNVGLAFNFIFTVLSMITLGWLGAKAYEVKRPQGHELFADQDSSESDDVPRPFG